MTVTVYAIRVGSWYSNKSVTSTINYIEKNLLASRYRDYQDAASINRASAWFNIKESKTILPFLLGSSDYDKTNYNYTLSISATESLKDSFGNKYSMYCNLFNLEEILTDLNSTYNFALVSLTLGQKASSGFFKRDYVYLINTLGVTHIYYSISNFSSKSGYLNPIQKLTQPNGDPFWIFVNPYYRNGIYLVYRYGKNGNKSGNTSFWNSSTNSYHQLLQFQIPVIKNSIFCIGRDNSTSAESMAIYSVMVDSNNVLSQGIKTVFDQPGLYTSYHAYLLGRYTNPTQYKTIVLALSGGGVVFYDIPNMFNSDWSLNNNFSVTKDHSKYNTILNKLVNVEVDAFYSNTNATKLIFITTEIVDNSNIRTFTPFYFQYNAIKESWDEVSSTQTDSIGAISTIESAGSELDQRPVPTIGSNFIQYTFSNGYNNTSSNVYNYDITFDD